MHSSASPPSLARQLWMSHTAYSIGSVFPGKPVPFLVALVAPLKGIGVTIFLLHSPLPHFLGLVPCLQELKAIFFFNNVYPA